MCSIIVRLALVLTLTCIFPVIPKSLPIVDPGLFVIQGVSTCGLGEGYCLLSNSCLVDSDFESDSDGGHCDGLKHAFNPNADFVCCKFTPITIPPLDSASVTENPEGNGNNLQLSSSTAPASSTTVTEQSTDSVLTETTTAAEETTTAASPSQTVTTKRTISTLNIAAHTNRILTNIQHLLQGGRMQPPGFHSTTEDGSMPNDKSLLPLILLGLNETSL